MDAAVRRRHHLPGLGDTQLLRQAGDLRRRRPQLSPVALLPLLLGGQDDQVLRLRLRRLGPLRLATRPVLGGGDKKYGISSCIHR